MIACQFNVTVEGGSSPDWEYSLRCSDGEVEMPLPGLGVAEKTFAVPGAHVLMVIARDTKGLNPVRKKYKILWINRFRRGCFKMRQATRCSCKTI